MNPAPMPAGRLVSVGTFDCLSSTQGQNSLVGMAVPSMAWLVLLEEGGSLLYARTAAENPGVKYECESERSYSTLNNALTVLFA